MKRTDVADERHAFRMQTPYIPRAELEETVSATILRVAKERFRARQAAQEGENASVLSVGGSEDDEDDTSRVEMSSAPRHRVRSKSGTRSVSRPRSVKFGNTSEGEMMDVDAPPAIRRSSSISTPRPPDDMPLLKTVVATDDELSYSLLRPSAQKILAKLDATLTILHAAQESQSHRPSEPGASEASSRPHSRSRSRSRSRRQGPTENYFLSPAARPAASFASSAAETQGPLEPPTNTRRVGRPRKVYPRLDGETDKAYVIRIARLRKQAIPYFSDDDDDNNDDNDDDEEDDEPEPPSDSTPVPRSANVVNARTAKSNTRRLSRRSRQRGAADAEESHRRKHDLSRVNLRDWRDVLGAAALAGFPPATLDRAALRCADLFGQSFTLHTLQGEIPNQTKAKAKLDRHVRYEPGSAAPRVLQDSDSNSDSNSGSGDDDDDSARPPPPPRSRSKAARPASPSRGQHFCTIDHCPRAVEPFTRRANLLRHLRLVHGYDGYEMPVKADDDDGDKDGFLKPIRVRPGWRAGDAEKEKGRGEKGKEKEKEKEKKQRVKRTRDEESEGTADTRMRDADSTSGSEDI